MDVFYVQKGYICGFKVNENDELNMLSVKNCYDIISIMFAFMTIILGIFIKNEPKAPPRSHSSDEMIAKMKPRPVPVSDTDLVERILNGDETAFYELYKRHAQYIAGVAYRILNNTGEVDDVVQDTFVTAARKLDNLKEPEHVRLWLVKIAVRHAQKRLRSSLRTRSIGDTSKIGTPTATDVRLASMLDDLKDVLRRIPKKFGEPWILHRLEGLTIWEVALACEMSVATVKRRVAAADKKVQKRIDVHV